MAQKLSWLHNCFIAATLLGSLNSIYAMEQQEEWYPYVVRFSMEEEYKIYSFNTKMNINEIILREPRPDNLLEKGYIVGEATEEYKAQLIHEGKLTKEQVLNFNATNSSQIVYRLVRPQYSSWQRAKELLSRSLGFRKLRKNLEEAIFSWIIIG